MSKTAYKLVIQTDNQEDQREEEETDTESELNFSHNRSRKESPKFRIQQLLYSHSGILHIIFYLVLIGVILALFWECDRQSAKSTHNAVAPLQSSAGSSNKRMAFVTLAAHEKDFIRSLTLAQMIKNTGSRYKTVIFVHPNENYSAWLNQYDEILPKVNAEVGYFPSTINKDLKRPKFQLRKERWKPAWIKLGFFSLYDQFSKMVYMDSDVYVARNVDDLFALGEVSAFTFGQEKRHEGDIGYINSGVCVIVPSSTAAAELLRLVQTKKFEGGDQKVYKSLFLEEQTAPFMMLAPIYNLNAELCKHTQFVRIYHLYHHKPWRNYTKNQEPIAPCENEVILKWQDAQNEVLEYVHAVGIDTARLKLMCC